MEVCVEFLKQVGTDPKPDFDKFHDLRDEAIARIVSFPGVKDELENQDIEDGLSTPPTHFDKPFNSITEKEFRIYISETLLHNRPFEVFFPLSIEGDIPDGLRLSRAKLVQGSSLPNEVLQFIQANSNGTSASTAYLTDARTKSSPLDISFFSCFIQVEVDAYGPSKATRKAARIAEEALNILRFVYEQDFSISQFAITQDDRHNITLQRMIPQTWVRYVAEMTGMTAELNDVFSKKETTELENRLRSSVRLFGLAVEAARPEIKFVLLTNALEGLLMTKGDRDYLRFRLAEKVSFLIEHEGASRRTLFERVKDLYDRRSDFVHQNVRYKPIQDQEVTELTMIFSRVFNRLLELRDEGYSSIEKGQGKNVEALIDDLKFD